MARKSSKQTSKEISKAPANNNYLGKIENEIKSNQSRLSMVLGVLIILVVGILVFNFLNKNKPSLGPAQNTQEEQPPQDISSDKLPGKYTIKEGDTLFLIAEKYYKNGEKFTEIAKANNISDVNTIEKGQVLEIPKLAETEAMALSTPPPSLAPSPSPSSSPEVSPSASPSPTTTTELGTGGGNTTIWGAKIEGNTYTVQEGDWLSTISARSYGDIFAYKRIADANNISNPDYIVPGQVLKIPR